MLCDVECARFRCGGCLPYGIGWYRKHSDLPAVVDVAAAVFELTLDDVQSLSTVWLNGLTLGQHTSGYSAQTRTYILPPQLFKSTKNVLVVKADAAGQLVIRAIRAAHLSALELGRLCECQR